MDVCPVCREYSASDAFLRERLGLSQAKNVISCVTVMRRESEPQIHQAIVIYPTRINFFDLLWDPATDPNESSGRARLLWMVSTDEIIDVRGSSHGVVIKTRTHYFQLPCASALTIRKLHVEITAAMRRAETRIVLNDALYRNVVQLSIMNKL
eukprot:GHVO01011671.1.p1 GENE.GHVO01011671.1~~GHVO01011671.1.p1  ORF type:complete len:153 (+),score=23.81 GHVO01011671.1:58-516(+)